MFWRSSLTARGSATRQSGASPNAWSRPSAGSSKLPRGRVGRCGRHAGEEPPKQGEGAVGDRRIPSAQDLDLPAEPRIHAPRKRDRLQQAKTGRRRRGLVRIRDFTARQAARLMGVPDSLTVPDTVTGAMRAFGDAVAVPVVHHLARHLLSVWSLRFRHFLLVRSLIRLKPESYLVSVSPGADAPSRRPARPRISPGHRGLASSAPSAGGSRAWPPATPAGLPIAPQADA